MMKWGRKKPSSSASSASNSSLSQPQLISHVFPLSWLSKFKHSTPDKRDSGLSRGSHKREQNLQKVNLKSPPNNYKYSTSGSACRDSSRFYTQDDDGFWRLSFGDQCDDNNGCTKLVVPPSYCGDCRSNVKEATMKKRSTQKNYKKQIGVQQTGEVEVERSESLRKTYRRIIAATSELQRELDEVKDGYRKSVEKEMPELELFQVMQMMGRSNLGEQHKHKEHQFRDGKREWERMKEEKIKEVLSKNEKQRKSVHIAGKVRSVRSPRTPSNKAETCKIRAIENLRKARMKKKMGEMVLDEKAAALESFAVVKCSREPHEDFRESMIEMIVEKRIRRPEQLEELLACYLTLNADEYHDLIIKVFRQVWRELEEQGYYNEKSLEERYRCV